MSEHALLAAIAAAPDDDEPRLVFADWLQQRGDPWGELIVTACEHERRPDPALAARLDELYRARFPAHSFIASDRGFVTAVEASDVAHLVGPEYTLLHDVRLRDACTASLRGAATWPLIGQITRLGMYRGVTVGHLVSLEISQLLRAASALVDLSVMHLDISRFELFDLFELPHAHQLRRLVILGTGDQHLTLDGLAWPPLDELRLAACRLEHDDIRDLFATPVLHGLTRLGLAGNPLDDRAAVFLAAQPFTRLVELDLRGTRVSPGGRAVLESRALALVR